MTIIYSLINANQITYSSDVDIEKKFDHIFISISFFFCSNIEQINYAGKVHYLLITETCRFCREDTFYDIKVCSDQSTSHMYINGTFHGFFNKV